MEPIWYTAIYYITVHCYILQYNKQKVQRLSGFTVDSVTLVSGADVLQGIMRLVSFLEIHTGRGIRSWDSTNG